MKENVVKDKSMLFAIRIVNLYKLLCEKKEYVMSRQVLKAGTSIGANLTEAECAISKKDFLAKVYIAFKECAETGYWLELLLKTGFLSEKEFESINGDREEIHKLLTTITKTTRKKLEMKKEE